MIKSGVIYIYVYTVFLVVMERYFEWNENKAISNYLKHGVRFEIASEVFDDPFAISEQDRVEDGEERWRTLGIVRKNYWLLMVAYTVWFDEEGNEIIRIISARRATKTERKIYENS